MFSSQDVAFSLDGNSKFTRLFHAVSEYDSSMLEALDEILREGREREEGEKEIFARYTDQSYTILSTLVSTVVPSYGIRDIQQNLTQGIHDRIATILPTDSDSGTEAQPEEESQEDAEFSRFRRTLRKVQQCAEKELVEVLSEQKVEQQQNEEEKRIALLPSTAEGIKRIAAKIEEERLKASEQSDSDYQSFLQETENFLQLKNVSYVDVDGVKHYESSIYVLSLLYIKNTGNTQLQSLIFNVLKEFLLGFSEYGLDENGARPIHYALSLSGGANEDLWLKEVIEPLMQKEKQRFAKQGAGKSFAEFMTDSVGYSPVRYVLSSVHCSAKTVSYVVSQCGTVVHKGAPSCESHTLLNRLVTSIGHYAFFCSLNRRFTSLRRDDLKQQARFLEESSEDTSKMRDSVHTASEKYSEAVETLREEIVSAQNELVKVLYLLCLEDRKIRAAVNAAVTQGKKLYLVAVSSLLGDLKRDLELLAGGADDSDNTGDRSLARQWSTLLTRNGVGNDYIGAKRAVHEFTTHALKNPLYVRCASECIHYLKTRKSGSGSDAAAFVSPFYPLANSMHLVVEKFFQNLQEGCERKYEVMKCLQRAKRDHSIFVACAAALIVLFTIGASVTVCTINMVQNPGMILCLSLVFTLSVLGSIALWVHDVKYTRELNRDLSSCSYESILRDVAAPLLNANKGQQSTSAAEEQEPVSAAVTQEDLPITRVSGVVPAVDGSNRLGVAV